jgi:hypothetical protein
MYILIFEDGTIKKAEEISDGTIGACIDGYVDILNISSNPPTQYCDGEWTEITNV